jgi:hypothetical protein
MFETFRLRYPVLNILCFSIVFALLFPLLAPLYPEDGPIPPLSAMAFLLALGCFSFPVLIALRAERSLPDCPPYWRVRYGAANGAYFFACFCLLTGTRFPSFDAVTDVSGAVIFGAIMALVVDFRGTQVSNLFDTDRSLLRLRSQFSQSLWLVWGGVQLLIALFLSVIDIGGTAPAIFILVIALGPVLPFPFRNQTSWREGDLLTFIGFAAATAGLFLA